MKDKVDFKGNDYWGVVLEQSLCKGLSKQRVIKAENIY